MNWSVVKEPTILVTSAVYGLLALVVTFAGIFGLWLGLLLFISIWRYSYAILRAHAQGHKRIPAPDIDSLNPVGEWGVFWHLILFPGLFLAGLLYPPQGLIVSVLVAAAFPASVALMGISSDISHSVRPGAMIAVARVLGADYFALVLAYIWVLVVGYLILFLLANFDGVIALLASYILEIWLLLASFSLIGSALRKHRLEFQIPGEIVPDEEKVLRRQHEDWHRDLDIAYTSFRSGLNASGYKALHDLVDRNSDSLEVNHWLLENMIDWEDKKYAFEVAAKLMSRLLAKRDGAAALEIYLRCRRRDPEFSLPEPQAERLAEYAESVGHTGVAAELGYN